MERNDAEESIGKPSQANPLQLSKRGAKKPLRAKAKLVRDLIYPNKRGAELPPWLVVGNRVVMRFDGWHHVASFGKEGPFVAAQRLFRELRAGRRKAR